MKTQSQLIGKYVLQFLEVTRERNAVLSQIRRLAHSQWGRNMQECGYTLRLREPISTKEIRFRHYNQIAVADVFISKSQKRHFIKRLQEDLERVTKMAIGYGHPLEAVNQYAEDIKRRLELANSHAVSPLGTTYRKYVKLLCRERVLKKQMYKLKHTLQILSADSDIKAHFIGRNSRWLNGVSIDGEPIDLKKYVESVQFETAILES